MSLSINPVVWFEIPVSDLSRAKMFYEQAFDVELIHSEMGPSIMECFPMEMGATGSTGALVQAEGYTPSTGGTLVYLNVSSLDDTVAAIEAAGGTILMPRTAIGEHGFIAHFTDSEGNRVAIHQAPDRE